MIFGKCFQLGETKILSSLIRYIFRQEFSGGYPSGHNRNGKVSYQTSRCEAADLWISMVEKCVRVQESQQRLERELNSACSYVPNKLSKFNLMAHLSFWLQETVREL